MMKAHPNLSSCKMFQLLEVTDKLVHLSAFNVVIRYFSTLLHFSSLAFQAVGLFGWEFVWQIQQRTLGSKAAAQLLEKLKPTYWFSTHLHFKFAASVQHGEGGPITKFLALGKCKPGRAFLHVPVPIFFQPPLSLIRANASKSLLYCLITGSLMWKQVQDPMQYHMM